MMTCDSVPQADRLPVIAIFDDDDDDDAAERQDPADPLAST